jgi:predicted ATPase
MEFEREKERAALARSLVEAKASRGGLTLIEGPAGIGKTRLLELAREPAEAEGMAVLERAAASWSATAASAWSAGF